MTRKVTPLVRRVAAQHGVDIDQVTPTGVGGRVSRNDVLAHAAKHRPAMTMPVRVVAGPPVRRQVQEQRSVWSSGTKVQIDGYGANPLVEDARQANPALYAAASSEAPAPTLFVSGDLPLFTASGADPALLRQLPWCARHAGAHATAPELATMLERYAGPAGWTAAAMDHPEDQGENGAYRARVSNWLSGNTPEARVRREQDQAARAAAKARGEAPPATADGTPVFGSLYGAHTTHQAQLAAEQRERQDTATRQLRERRELEARQTRVRR